MDGLLVVSFSAIFYAFVKKGLAFGSTFVSRVAARASLPHRVFCLSRSRSLFVGSIVLNWEYSLQFGMIMNIPIHYDNTIHHCHAKHTLQQTHQIHRLNHDNPPVLFFSARAAMSG